MRWPRLPSERMPGAIARTSAYALGNVALPHVLSITEMGSANALENDADLANGLSIHDGQVTCEAVAQELGYRYVDVCSIPVAA